MFGQQLFTLLAQVDSAMSPANAPASNSGDVMNLAFGGLLIFAVFILPFILGAFLSKALRMPNHGFSIGLILAAVIGSALTIGLGQPRYGVDIKGGTILKYEIDKSVKVDVGQSDPQATGDTRVRARDLVPSLTQRINPTGTKEIVIRPMGEDQIEIIVPNVDQLEIAEIKRIVQQAGILKFRIVANAFDHGAVIERAQKQAASTDLLQRLNNEVLDENGTVVGLWQEVGRDPRVREGVRPLYSPVSRGDVIRDSKTGRILNFPTNLERELGVEKWLAKENIENIDLLMSLVGNNKPFEVVTGDDLSTISKGTGKDGAPIVQFGLNPAGASRLYQLTVRNEPTENVYRHMAIILDGRVLSAPRLNGAISDQGLIEGNFSNEEVDFLINILRSGSLPAALGKEPVSQEIIGAVLGADTINKGFRASAASLAITLIFVVIYYRFCGLIACIALLLNLAMVYASMILIQQPITLPGLAGLVLTVGMSVDANVLVYERIREEVARRATGRMAIRNGFDNAMTTIIDSNLTTLISAIVLYAVGTDQIRGFAVPLIIGLVTSMFTAVFCSRVLFDISEKLRIVSFSMADAIAWLRRAFLGDKDFDFMKARTVCYALSGTLIVIGLIGTFLRGKDILDIDFLGGTSVVFTLTEPATAEEVRDITSKIFDKDEKGNPIQSTLTNVEMTGQTPGTIYRLDSSLQDVRELTKRLADGFKDSKAKLITYRVDSVGEPVAAEDGKSTSYTLKFKSSQEGATSKINAAALVDSIVEAAKSAGQGINVAQIDVRPDPLPEDWTRESMLGADVWKVTFPFDAASSGTMVAQLQKQMEAQPVWLSFNNIGERVAGQMQTKAIASLVLSLFFINIYIWFRFHKVAYGLAAVIALIHDVLITLGFIAISHWFYPVLGFLQIEDFKISLTIVAAFLTIIGYSLNDTIVVFDRIREVKGKSPNLTEAMVNKSVNETLGRTIMTSSTTIMTIIILYFFGGDGIHSFAFALFVGIVVGTYSSIFVASPVLLWMVGKEAAQANPAIAKGQVPARR